MSEKRKEMWVKIITPEGEARIASPAYIKKLLEIPDLSNIYNRLNHIETKIDKLEAPQRREDIIEVLRGQGKHNKIWLGNRIDYQGYDLIALIEKGIVIETKSGTQPMIELSGEEAN